MNSDDVTSELDLNCPLFVDLEEAKMLPNG